jgi:hypothetical protein
MRGALIEFALSQKAGAWTASSSILAWLATLWGWIDANMLKMSALASLILVIVMIVSHICATSRQNRESRAKIIKDEIEIELLRRKLKGDDDARGN